MGFPKGKMALPPNPPNPGVQPVNPTPDIAGMPDPVGTPDAAPGQTGGQLSPPEGKQANP